VLTERYCRKHVLAQTRPRLTSVVGAGKWYGAVEGAQHGRPRPRW
jgi:hypothetical protein